MSLPDYVSSPVNVLEHTTKVIVNAIKENDFDQLPITYNRYIYSCAREIDGSIILCRSLEDTMQRYAIRHAYKLLTYYPTTGSIQMHSLGSVSRRVLKGLVSEFTWKGTEDAELPFWVYANGLVVGGKSK